MATGDQNDMTNRLMALLPSRWFAGATPVLNAVLQAFAQPFAAIYSMLGFVKAQQRIETAQGGFLDLCSQDYFGGALPRLSYEGDSAFAARIQFNLTAPRGTRAGLAGMLTQLTGTAPIIFEPTRPADTGAFGSLASPAAGGGLFCYTANDGTGGAGAFGTLLMPYQFFVTVQFPATGFLTFAGIAGWGDLASPAVGGGFGFGSIASPAAGGGALATVDPESVPGVITEAFIYEQIKNWIPVGSLAWTYIT
jgi:hypothetical protein